MFRLAKASPEQLNLAMGVMVVGGLVLVLLLCVLVTWSKRKEAARGRTGKARAASARRAKGRSG